MQLRPTSLPGCITFTNKLGVKFCILTADVKSAGGGTYISRVLAARNVTKADVFVFSVPNNEYTDRTMRRIYNGRNDLMSAVEPLILPFKVVVVLGSTKEFIMNFYAEKTWSDIKL